MTRINGSIGLDIAEFKSNVAELQRQIKVVESAFQAAADGSAEWGATQEGLEAKVKSLTSIIELQKKKIQELIDHKQRVVQEYGANSKAAQDLEIKINKETAALNKNTHELNQAQSAMDKLGSETADVGKETEKSAKNLEDGEKSLKDYGKETEAASEKTRRFGEALGNMAKAAAVGLGALTGLIGAAAIKLGKEVVDQFGELEQSLGGSEAVFGQYAANVQKIGEDAYKNLGLAQADYLATANKMGALFQGSGLDQARSLELTTQAMQRAADMASVMGIDVASAMEAIAGAAKGNFTMMDNLGVAMNATTVEAYALSKGLDFAWDSASNAEKAEVAMQMFFERTEQYAGNFAREATQTITGSFGLMRAAVKSFVAGLGNADADMVNLTNNMVDAFEAVVNNVVPVLDNIVTALPTTADAILGAVGGMIPKFIKITSDIFEKVLHTITRMMPSLIPAGVSAITTIFRALMDNLPLLINAAVTLVMALVSGINSALPELISSGLEVIKIIVGSIGENLPMLIEVGFNLLQELARAIIQYLPDLIPAAVAIVLRLAQGIVDNIPLVIEVAIDLIIALIKGILNALPLIIEQMPKLVQSIVNGISDAIPMLIDAAVEIITTLVEYLVRPDTLTLLVTASIDILTALAGALVKNVPTLLWAVPQIFKSVFESFKSMDWKSIGKNIIEGLVDGLKKSGQLFVDALSNLADEAWRGIKDFFGIKSPSRLMRDSIGKNIGLGMALGIEDSYQDVQKAMRTLSGAVISNPIVSGSRITAVDGVPVSGMDSRANNITINLSQHNVSPKALSARDTYIAMRKAERDLQIQLEALHA